MDWVLPRHPMILTFAPLLQAKVHRLVWAHNLTQLNHDQLSFLRFKRPANHKVFTLTWSNCQQPWGYECIQHKFNISCCALNKSLTSHHMFYQLVFPLVKTVLQLGEMCPQVQNQETPTEKVCCLKEPPEFLRPLILWHIELLVCWSFKTGSNTRDFNRKCLNIKSTSIPFFPHICLKLHFSYPVLIRLFRSPKDCLFRAKSHATWVLPSVDMDEYFRLNSGAIFAGGKVPQDAGSVFYPGRLTAGTWSHDGGWFRWCSRFLPWVIF